MPFEFADSPSLTPVDIHAEREPTLLKDVTSFIKRVGPTIAKQNITDPLAFVDVELSRLADAKRKAFQEETLPEGIYLPPDLASQEVKGMNSLPMEVQALNEADKKKREKETFIQQVNAREQDILSNPMTWLSLGAQQRSEELGWWLENNKYSDDAVWIPGVESGLSSVAGFMGHALVAGPAAPLTFTGAMTSGYYNQTMKELKDADLLSDDAALNEAVVSSMLYGGAELVSNLFSFGLAKGATAATGALANKWAAKDATKAAATLFRYSGIRAAVMTLLGVAPEYVEESWTEAAQESIESKFWEERVKGEKSSDSPLRYLENTTENVKKYYSTDDEAKQLLASVLVFTAIGARGKLAQIRNNDLLQFGRAIYEESLVRNEGLSPEQAKKLSVARVTPEFLANTEAIAWKKMTGIADKETLDSMTAKGFNLMDLLKMKPETLGSVVDEFKSSSESPTYEQWKLDEKNPLRRELSKQREYIEDIASPGVPEWFVEFSKQTGYKKEEDLPVAYPVLLARAHSLGVTVKEIVLGQATADATTAILRTSPEQITDDKVRAEEKLFSNFDEVMEKAGSLREALSMLLLNYGEHYNEATVLFLRRLEESDAFNRSLGSKEFVLKKFKNKQGALLTAGKSADSSINRLDVEHKFASGRPVLAEDVKRFRAAVPQHYVLEGEQYLSNDPTQVAGVAISNQLWTRSRMEFADEFLRQLVGTVVHSTLQGSNKNSPAAKQFFDVGTTLFEATKKSTGIKSVEEFLGRLITDSALREEVSTHPAVPDFRLALSEFAQEKANEMGYRDPTYQAFLGALFELAQDESVLFQTANIPEKVKGTFLEKYFPQIQELSKKWEQLEDFVPKESPWKNVKGSYLYDLIIPISQDELALGRASVPNALSSLGKAPQNPDAHTAMRAAYEKAVSEFGKSTVDSVIEAGRALASEWEELTEKIKTEGSLEENQEAFSTNSWALNLGARVPPAYTEYDMASGKRTTLYQTADIARLPAVGAKQFADMFQSFIKGKDKSVEDMNRIAETFLYGELTPTSRERLAVYLEQQGLLQRRLDHLKNEVQESVEGDPTYYEKLKEQMQDRLDETEGYIEYIRRINGEERVQELVPKADPVALDKSLAPPKDISAQEFFKLTPAMQTVFMRREKNPDNWMPAMENLARETEEKRRYNLKEWQELYEEDSAYRPGEKVLSKPIAAMLFSLASQYNVGFEKGKLVARKIAADNLHEVMNPVPEVINRMIELLEQGVSGKQAFVQAYQEFLDKSENTALKERNEWVVIPRGTDPDRVFAIASKTSKEPGAWCIGYGRSYTESYSERGDVHFYIDPNGQPRIAMVVAPDGSLIEPPSGIGEGQTRSIADDEILSDYAKENPQITGLQDMLSQKELTAAIKESLEKGEIVDELRRYVVEKGGLASALEQKDNRGGGFPQVVKRAVNKLASTKPPEQTLGKTRVELIDERLKAKGIRLLTPHERIFLGSSKESKEAASKFNNFRNVFPESSNKPSLERQELLLKEFDAVQELVIFGDNKLYQQEGTVKRGEVSFDKLGQFRMKFYETADLNTFMHEWGHVFYETLSLREKGALAKNFLGKKGIPLRGSDDYILLQEQFANTFVDYLSRGVSPSLELRETFTKMQDALLSLYEAANKESPGKISPVFKKVFDNMLSTQKQRLGARMRFAAEAGKEFLHLTLANRFLLLTEGKELVADAQKAGEDYTVFAERQLKLVEEKIVPEVFAKHSAKILLDGSYKTFISRFEKMTEESRNLQQKAALSQATKAWDRLRKNRTLIGGTWKALADDVLRGIDKKRNPVILKQYYELLEEEYRTGNYVPESLFDLGGVALSDLSRETLEQIAQDINYIVDGSIQEIKGLRMTGFENLKAMLESVREQLESKVTKAGAGLFKTKDRDVRRTKGAFTNPLAKLWHVEHILLSIFDSKPGEPLYDLMYGELNAGREKELLTKEFLTGILNASLEGMDLDPRSVYARGTTPLERLMKRAQGARTETFNFKLEAEQGKHVPSEISLTKAEILHLYLMAQNETVLQKVLRNGVNFVDWQETRVGIKVSADDLKKIFGTLTADDMYIAAAIKSYYAEEYKILSEAFFDTNGLYLKQEENYVPTTSLKIGSGEKIFMQPALYSNAFMTAFRKDSESISPLKDRQSHGNPMVVGDIFKVMISSLHDVSKYAGLAKPIRNLKAILYDGQGKSGVGAQNLIKQNFGNGIYENLLDYMKSISGETNPVISEEGTLEGMRRRAVVSILSLNVPVAVLQYAGIAAYIPEVDLTLLSQALRMGPVSVQEMELRSVFMRDRFSTSPIRDVKETYLDAEVRNTFSKVKGLEAGDMTPGLGLMLAVDKQVIGYAWRIAELEFPGDRKKQKERAEYLVRMTQPTADVMDQNYFRRQRGFFWKSVTSFGGTRSTLANLYMKHLIQYSKDGDTDHIKKLLLFTFFNTASMSFVNSGRAFLFGYTPEEGADWWKLFFKTFLNSTVGNFLGIGELSEALFQIAAGDQVQSTSLLAGQFQKLAQSAGTVLTKDEKTLNDVATLISRGLDLAGIPASNVKNLLFTPATIGQSK